MTKLAVAHVDAMAAARDVIEHLAGSYERIEVAGSLRRGKAAVGDIELLAISRVVVEPSGFWGDMAIIKLRERVNDLLAIGVLAEAEKPAMGDHYCRLVHAASGLQVDLFITSAEQFGLMLAIRTGPDLWSRWLVTEAQRRGFHVNKGALRRGPQHIDPRARDACECEVVATPEEADVFTALRLPFEAPERRGLSERSR